MTSILLAGIFLSVTSLIYFSLRALQYKNMRARALARLYKKPYDDGRSL